MNTNIITFDLVKKMYPKELDKIMKEYQKFFLGNNQNKNKLNQEFK